MPLGISFRCTRVVITGRIVMSDLPSITTRVRLSVVILGRSLCLACPAQVAGAPNLLAAGKLMSQSFHAGMLPFLGIFLHSEML